MQRTKSKLLSILLILVMLLSLLPTTALAAGIPDASNVYVDGGKNFYNSTRLYYKNGDPDGSFSGTSTDFNAAYDPATGTLTLEDYSGGSISVGGTGNPDITVKLIGTNIINGSLTNEVGGDITITSDSSGTLSITNILSDSKNAIGIEAGLSGSYTTGKVTIMGDAKVIISVTNNKSDINYANAYGIFAKENITISESASVDITCATPNNTTGGDHCNGLRADKNVTIDTNGTIKIDVTNAGKDENNGYSFGVYPMGTATLTKVGNMEVKWKKDASNSVNSGGAVYKKGTSLSGTDYAINEDETNCYVSYRKGTPYTVTVEYGTLAGTGVVSHANNNGNFLAGDTVEIKPSEMKGKSGEVIPFQKWTSEQVTFTDPTAENNSFNVPANAVTVTAKHSPFVGTPTFTPIGTASTEGTLTFKTKVTLGDGNESFALVKEAEVDNTTEYKSINPSTASLSSPYEYSGKVNFNNVPEGNYYVAEKLNGAWYLSDLFPVNYTAAPTPTANINLSQTSTMDFGSLEAGYTAAPAAQTVTITNNGTANTGALTIALEGTNAGRFTVSPSSITDIAASGTDTFTVQPNTGLSAGIYNATVKVSGTGVTEKSFDVKFTVTAPLTAIAVPTANSVTYDGTKKTGVNAGTGYTLGGDYEATDVGATDYAATATLNTGYKWTDGSTGDKTITWNISKKTPTVADFTFAPPTNLTYDGNNKTASVTLKSSLSKSGAITVKYEKDSASVTETKNVGEYTVKIDVAVGDNFEAISDLTDSAWKFSITPAEWGTPTETLTPVNPTTAGGNDGQITGTTNAMQYKKSTGSSWADCSGDVTGLTAGTYYVRYKADSNHTASDTNYKTVTLTDPGTTLYGVTVTDGTAIPTGDQAAGAEVTITANTKTGFNFKEWTGLNDSDYKTGFTKASNPATFVMPASAVNVTATYDPAALSGTAGITGTEKFGQTLTANTTGITNNTGTFSYQWKRDGADITSATNSTYTLVEDDIGKTITVAITSNVQTGEITSAATGTIEKADGPAAPSVTPVACTNSSNNDGRITGVNTTMEYSTVSDFATKTACTSTEITGLVNGTYYVRVAETTTHKAGTAATVNVPAYTPGAPTEYTISFNGNGGTPSASNMTTVGKKLSSLPTATHSGSYSFAGWYTAASGGTQITTAYVFSSNTTVYAHWTYTGGGGGGGSSSGSSAATPSVSDKAAKELKNAKEGSTVTIDMKGETKLPASVTKEIAGKDVTVELDMGGGMVWSFNGLDVPKGGVRLDLGVKTGTKTIPAKVINALTGETTTIQLQLNHNGPFGMSLNLSVDLGKKHNGMYANLYFYNSKSGELEFQSAGMISGGKASWAFDHASDYAIVIDKESHEPMTFNDVPASAYYAEAVNWAVAKKITGGIGNGLFGPNDPCTRAQIVTFLWRAAGSPAPRNTGTAFGDVKPGSFYEQAVAWAVENGITGGTGDGKFSPDATCTRAQSVTFLYRAVGSPAVSGSAEFGDVATNAYYADAVAWAAKNGITGGIGGGLFGSGSDCTRGQIVTFLYRNYQSK